jgi:uncharacterized protein
MNGPALLNKQVELRRVLEESVAAGELLLVAYSGGVDSAYLAWEAHTVLGGRMLAVIADSPSLPRKELASAIAFAGSNSIPLKVVQTREVDSQDYAKNDFSRCFYCKDELFRVMGEFSKQLGTAKTAYGRNLDDNADFRPGQQAAAQYAVLSPLAEAGLGKADVRALAKRMGLPLWDKPASACLASRIEYGREVTTEALSQVEAAEDYLHSLGFRQLRVRHHGDIARVELDRQEISQSFSLEMLDRISQGIKALGFKYVALDAGGYRSGSMNDVVPIEALFSKF